MIQSLACSACAGVVGSDRSAFARVAGVEPTSNVAERVLRPAVRWRKGSFGTHSGD